MKGITHTQGFTLVELIAVILIMGILSATALPRFMDFGSDARKASLKSIAGTMKTVAETTKMKGDIEGFSKNPRLVGYQHGGGNTLILHYGNPEAQWERTWQYLIDINAKYYSGYRTQACVTDADYCAVGGTQEGYNDNSVSLYFVPPGYDASNTNTGNCYVQYWIAGDNKSYKVNLVDTNC